MISRTPGAAAGGTAIVLLLTALLPSAVHAANRNTSAQKQEARLQTVTPAKPPKPPAARSPASLTRQTPLAEAVDLLRNSTTPPLKIIVLWKPLGEAGIYRDTPIGIDGSAGLSASQCLEALALSLSAGASARVGYRVDQGVITLATVGALPAPRQITRVYDISDLVAPPARYSVPSLGIPTGFAAPGGLAGYSGYGAYGASAGVNLSSPAGSPYRRTGPTPRSYRSR